MGLANGSNPIPIVIPCHRVIGSNGKLTGYGGGLPIKEKLLALERRQLACCDLPSSPCEILNSSRRPATAAKLG